MTRSCRRRGGRSPPTFLPDPRRTRRPRARPSAATSGSSFRSGHRRVQRPAGTSFTAAKRKSAAGFICGDAVGVTQVDAVGVDVEHAVVGVDGGHAADTGEGVGAPRDQLGAAVLGEQCHHHVGVFGADGQTHRTSHAEHAVLGVQDDALFGGDVIGDLGGWPMPRLTNAPGEMSRAITAASSSIDSGRHSMFCVAISGRPGRVSAAVHPTTRRQRSTV